jgi:hypothetical protein
MLWGDLGNQNETLLQTNCPYYRDKSANIKFVSDSLVKIFRLITVFNVEIATSFLLEVPSLPKPARNEINRWVPLD